MAETREVLVALGSNLGDRLEHIRAALKALDRGDGVRVLRHSRAFDTAPAGPIEQPRYLNAAAALVTDLEARELLNRMLSVEAELGRDRSRELRFGPRTIDLDLILDGESVFDEPGLAVPHPRFHEREFVLVPLLEIAPDARDPRTGQTVESLARACARARTDAEPSMRSVGTFTYR